MVVLGVGEKGEVLDEADEPVSIGEAKDVLRIVFGLDADVTPLSGERDQNFRVIAVGEASEWILKISNSAERSAVSDLQTRILLHLAQTDPGLPVPRLKATSAGEPGHRWRRDNGVTHLLRVLSLAPGRPLRLDPPSAAELESLGRAIARLDRALVDFRHPAETHELAWDLQHGDKLANRVAGIADLESRSLVEAGLAGVARWNARFRESGPPRPQMIHNDLNPDNVLVDGRPPRFSAFIDFGDAVRAPLVQELAVAAAYHVRDDIDPFEAVRLLASGFGALSTLEDKEVECLPDFIAGRMALTVAITSWRAARHPHNRDYILRNQSAALTGLSRLLSDPGRSAADRLRRTLGRARA